MSKCLSSTWEVFAQYFYGRGPLGIADLLVALFECVGFKALPGEGPPQEIHEHVT